MAWEIILVNGTKMTADATVMTPDGVIDPSTLSPGDLVCIFPDGHMPVEIASIVEE